MKRSLLLLLIALGAILFPTMTFAQGTAFTYQGRLNDGANAANGSYDLRFELFDAAIAGAPQGNLLTNSATVVSNGLFTVTLDFGNQFPGANRWLEIGVRTNGGSAFSTLVPRQPLTATPYATFAGRVSASGISGTIPASALSGAYSGPVNLSNVNNSFTGNGGGLTNLNAWRLGGNAGTSPGANFIGTTDNQPLEFRANGSRVLRLVPDPTSPNIIAGSPANSAVGGIRGASVLGGGSASYPNIVAADNATVVGGISNTASGGASVVMGQFNSASGYASVASGYGTTARGFSSFAAGNSARAIHDGSFVWGDNTFTEFASTTNDQFLIRAQGGVGINTNNPNGAALAVNGRVTVNGSFKGGYSGNIISNEVVGGFIGGGGDASFPNIVGGGFASVVGGRNNTASGLESTAMGSGNKATGDYATAMGGSTTASGSFSAALGFKASASGYASVAEGYQTIATGDESIAMGYFSSASGDASIAMGFLAKASGIYSVALGSVTTASASYSTALGRTTTASGDSSTALGRATTASGDSSTAMGFSSTALGSNSAAIGESCLASNLAAMALGYHTVAAGSGSTALGLYSQALHNNTFVWSDGSTKNFSSTGSNQFSVNATGGVRLGDNTPAISFGSTGRQMLNLWSTNYGIGVQASSLYFRCNDAGPTDGFIWYRGGAHNDGYANPGGGVELMHLVQGALYVNGTLASTSDRNAKENFTPVNAKEVLNKVVAMPITRWNYKNDSATPHLGPVAQDFYAAFGVGPDHKHITTVDESGVALAAIQGLNQKLEDRSQSSEVRVQKLEAENAALKARLERLEQLLSTLATR